MVLVAPIIAHGIYDTIIFTVDVSSNVIAILLMLSFIAFCFFLWKFGFKKISQHQAEDKVDMQNKAEEALSEEKETVYNNDENTKVM